MLRYISFFAFVLSVFIAPKTSAQSLQKPLVKEALIDALKHAASDSVREGILLELCRSNLTYSEAPHKVDSAMFYFNLAQKYYVKQNNFLQDRSEILAANINREKNIKAFYPGIFAQLIRRSHINGDKINEAFAWSGYASTLVPNEKNDSIIALCFQHAATLASAANETGTALDWQVNIAASHVRQHKYDLAERELLYIINHPKANTEDVLDASEGLTNLYFTKGIFDKALFYALKNERLMEASGDSLLALNYLGNLSNIYFSLGKFEESIYWSKRAQDHMLGIKNYDFVYKISNAIVAAYLRIDKNKEALEYIQRLTKQYKPASLDDKRIFNLEMGNIYVKQKKYNEAEKYYIEMHRFTSMEQELPKETIATDNYKLGNLYLLMGQYPKAKIYLDKSLVDYAFRDRVDLLMTAHSAAFKADSSLGLYLSAIRHLEQNHQLYNSSFNVSTSKQINELEIAYQTEKKEKDIALLKGLERQENIKLLRSESVKNLIIIGSCLLAIIIGLLFRQNRIRKKNSQIIVQKNEHLEQLISEKNWLLKEVHHRVKNNLHTVICLLESQANYLENDALKAIETSQHRIYAMSLIHQKLYQSDDIKTIDMQDYIGELVRYLKDSFAPIENIAISFSVEPIKLGVSHAIPMGLIINEAVTNAIQHAFPGNIFGKIKIKLTRSGDDITLLIQDDGIGYNVHDAETDSLGIELIKGLAKELKGTALFKEINGTTIKILFSLDPLESIISQNEPEQELV
jgi:two-component sensor histidine kinase